jgi:aminoglycoside phosphotransferase family enzyme
VNRYKRNETVKVQHADVQTEEQTCKKNQQISMGVVQGYNLQRSTQHQRKQVLRNQNRENKRETTGPNSAKKNVIEKRTVNGTKRDHWGDLSVDGLIILG